MMPIDISDSELSAILDACLEGITLHAWSVEECLRRYEPYRAVLGPLLRMAVALADERQIAPSETFQSDSVSRLMARLPERTASLTGVTRRPRPIRGRFIPLFPTTAVVLIMLAALTLAGMLLAAGIALSLLGDKPASTPAFRILEPAFLSATSSPAATPAPATEAVVPRIVMTVIPSGSPVQETPSVPAPPSVASPAPPTETETVCSRGQIHPEAQLLSERYSVSYEEVINWFCLGFGFGEIDQAYALAQLNSVPVEQIFALRIAGMGWGEIRQMFDTTPPASNLGAGQGNKPDK